MPPSMLANHCQHAPCSHALAQAADQGIGGAAWEYKDLRSQQLLARLIERLRALPQPIICAVQVRRPRLGEGVACVPPPVLQCDR